MNACVYRIFSKPEEIIKKEVNLYCYCFIVRNMFNDSLRDI